jgi:hypothetical protein
VIVHVIIFTRVTGLRVGFASQVAGDRERADSSAVRGAEATVVSKFSLRSHIQSND